MKLSKKQEAFFKALDKEKRKNRKKIEEADIALIKMANAINRDIKNGKIKLASKSKPRRKLAYA